MEPGAPSLAAAPSPPPHGPANKLRELGPCLGSGSGWGMRPTSGTPARGLTGPSWGLHCPPRARGCFAWDLRVGGGLGSFAFFPSYPWVPKFREGCERPPLAAQGSVRVSPYPPGNLKAEGDGPSQEGGCMSSSCPTEGTPGAEFPGEVAQWP